MRKKIDIRHLAAALLAALMLLACLPVTQADAAGNTIHISSEAELRDLAASCALDTWSRDKNVVLDSDLTLADPSFLPIPTFGGSFDGQGHTIHNVSITDSLSPAGLFGVVQAGGSVRSLHVVGTVTPSGDGRSVGGIAGENNGAIEKCSFTGTVSGQVYVGGIAGHTGASGSILACETRGAVIGDSMTGGITGYNEGLLADCTNSACVNVESTDPRLDLEDLDLTLTPDLSKLGQANAGASAADTGGIAGYSAGTLSDCVNHGAVGYQHIGYNTGGVVGRSCGQLLRCRNDGSIAGRKDVGGVVGQIEPYIQMDASPTYLSELNRQLYELKSLTDQAANDAQDGAGDVSGRLNDMNDYLKDALSDPQDPLAAITGFGSRLKDLNNSASGSVDTVADDLRGINSKFNEVSNTVLAAISAAGDPASVISDGSQGNIDKITLGKTSACTNSGAVSGDVNTGGIAGSIAIEYELDPEDDVSADLDGEYRRQYEYRAVVQQCANTGAVSAKRSNTGGIAGRMDLGLIISCESYGSVESDSGSYVGGIAGLTAATVRSSYAKCTLSGKKYVGGIVGSGVAEKSDGSASTVTGCWSLVDITGCQQYEGAVSGADTGTFTDNYFVSDTLAGINRQSFAGRAEPVSFDTLAAADGMPGGMTTFTLSFVSDGKVLTSRTFSYGASFDSSVYPPLPEKDGIYAHWDRTDLHGLHLDTVVTAVYDALLPTLSSEQTREDGRPVILAGGDFNDGDTMAATALTLTPEEFHAADGSLADRAANWFSYLKDGQLPPLTVNRRVAEQWRVSLPDDGRETHTLRYLPSQDASHLRLYVNDGGGWQAVSCDTVGSYLSFTAGGANPEFAVVTTASVWWPLAAAIAVCVAIVLAILLGRRHRRRRTAAAVSAPETAENAVESTETPARISRPAKKKKRRWWIPVSIVAGIAAAAAVLLTATGLGRQLNAWRLLHRALNADSLAMTVSVQSGETFTASADVCRTRADTTRIVTVRWQGVTVYCTGDAVYLENGRAYRLSSSMTLSDLAALFRKAHVDCGKTDADTLYTAALSAADADALLTLLEPEVGDLTGIDRLTAVLTVADGRARSLRLTAGPEDAPVLTAVMDFTAKVTAPQVPEAVTAAIAGGTEPENTVLPADTLRLLRSWATLRSREVLAADLTLTADCGPLVLRDTLQYDRRTVDGQDFTAVRKGALSLYFSGDKLCDAEGHVLTTDDALASQARLLQLAYQLVLNGTAACTQTGGTDTYTLTLDEAGAAEFAAAIAPDIQSQHVAFTGGRVTMEVQDTQLCNVRITCSGSISVALTEANASLSADIRFVSRNYPFPRAVLNALQ
ncbi:MAG: hypothetical protein EGR26_08225 [Clostridiales bacterium]|nr:hypothetical protein [Clostridiales bacterium]